MSDWTDADYGAEDGRADALAGREPSEDALGTDDYAAAYLGAFDAVLAEREPDVIRRVSS